MSYTIRTTKFGIAAMIEALDRWVDMSQCVRDDNARSAEAAMKEGDFRKTANISTEVADQDKAITEVRAFVARLQLIDREKMLYSQRMSFHLHGDVPAALESALDCYIDMNTDCFVESQQGTDDEGIVKNLQTLCAATNIEGQLAALMR